MNFKTITIILGIIFMILVTATVLKWRNQSAVPVLNPDQNSSGTTSAATTTINPLPNVPGGTISIFTTGGTVIIPDITKSDEAQNVGEGMYHFEAPASFPGAPFAFLYSTRNNSFSISIESKPIAQNREIASRYILSLLKISETEACRLKVLVGVPYAVDENLAGKNLGLSFCPGSVTL